MNHLPPLPQPRTIVIFRALNCWAANIPDWDAQGVPLPFREWVCALQAKELGCRLHPTARIVLEEEPR